MILFFVIVKRCKNRNTLGATDSASQSAEGAEYNSQGQARSASPLVTYTKRRRGLKGRNIIPPLSGLGRKIYLSTRGDVPTSRDLPLAVISRAFGANRKAVITKETDWLGSQMIFAAYA